MDHQNHSNDTRDKITPTKQTHRKKRHSVHIFPKWYIFTKRIKINCLSGITY